jgi:PhzF family phenazine biosynthesis protein
MTTLRYAQVDAFTARPFFGNPVAVVLGADGLSSEEMQHIAAWTNLSETTFVLSPTIPVPAYRLRIFTPSHELPFAGHPTIGSCHAVVEAGIVHPVDGRLVQQCGAGDLPLRIVEERGQRWIYVEAPEAVLVREFPDLSPAISAALGDEIATPVPTAFRNGPLWLFARFAREEQVRALAPDMSALVKLAREHGITGIAAFSFVDSGDSAVHIRCFAPASGVPEDPVTGSANAALPAHLAHHGLLGRVGKEYLATQGTELGRDGRVRVRVLDARGRAEIGGQAVTVIEGELRARLRTRARLGA